MQQAEGLYKQLFELTAEPLAVWTPDGRIASVNDAYLTLTGKERDGLVGLDSYEAFPPNPHEPGADANKAFLASFDRVLRTGRKEIMPVFRHDFPLPDGSWEKRHWQLTNSAVRGEDGTLLAVVEHAADAQELASVRNAATLDQLADALLHANDINEALGDPDVDAALRRALLKVGRLLASGPKPLH